MGSTMVAHPHRIIYQHILTVAAGGDEAAVLTRTWNPEASPRQSCQTLPHPSPSPSPPSNPFHLSLSIDWSGSFDRPGSWFSKIPLRVLTGRAQGYRNSCSLFRVKGVLDSAVCSPTHCFLAIWSSSCWILVRRLLLLGSTGEREKINGLTVSSSCSWWFSLFLAFSCWDKRDLRSGVAFGSKNLVFARSGSRFWRFEIFFWTRYFFLPFRLMMLLFDFFL